MIDEGSIWIRSYHRLIESVDLAQVLALDKVPPDYIDKGVYCLHALGHTLSMSVFRSLFPWLVAAQVVGVVMVALRLVPLVCIPFVVLPVFWGGLVGACP